MRLYPVRYGFDSFHSLNSDIPLVSVILCDGTGSRLWPLSRASYPKRYWALAGNGEDTLLQQTQQPLKGLRDLAVPESRHPHRPGGG